jgi:hypothetical protein
MFIAPSGAGFRGTRGINETTEKKPPARFVENIDQNRRFNEQYDARAECNAFFEGDFGIKNWGSPTLRVRLTESGHKRDACAIRFVNCYLEFWP